MSTPDPEKSCRLLFFIILAILIAGIAVFLIVRPTPFGGVTGSSTSSPAAPKK